MIFGPSCPRAIVKQTLPNRALSSQSKIKIARNMVLGAGAGYLAMKYGCWNDFFQSINTVPFFHPPIKYLSVLDNPCLIASAFTSAVTGRFTYNNTPEYALKKLNKRLMQHDEKRFEEINERKNAHIRANSELKKIKKLCDKNRKKTTDSEFKDQFTQLIKKIDDRILNHVAAINTAEAFLRVSKNSNE